MSHTGGASGSGGVSGGGGGGAGAAGRGAQGGAVDNTGGRAGAGSGGGAGSAGHAASGGAAGSNTGGRGGTGGAGPGTGGSGPGTGGTGVNTDPTYAGCTFTGGINRSVIASMDTSRSLCVVLVLNSPGTNPYPGLTLPANTGVEYAFAQAMAPGAQNCLARFPSTNAVSATDATGSVTFFPTPQPTANVDVTLTFPATAVVSVKPAERLVRTSLLFPLSCQ